MDTEEELAQWFGVRSLAFLIPGSRHTQVLFVFAFSSSFPAYYFPSPHRFPAHTTAHLFLTKRSVPVLDPNSTHTGTQQAAPTAPLRHGVQSPSSVLQGLAPTTHLIWQLRQLRPFCSKFPTPQAHSQLWRLSPLPSSGSSIADPQLRLLR